MQTFSITDFSGDTRYGQAVARVRVLESQLLPRRAFVRMAEAPTWDALLEELRGSLYAEPLAPVRRAVELDEAFAEIEQRRRRLIRDLKPEPHLIDALDAWSDFNTLKIVLKTHLTRAPHRLSLNGEADRAHEIRERLEAKRMLSKPLEPARKAAEADFEQHRSLFRLAVLVDRGYQEHVLDVFDTSGIPFLGYFARYWIDLANVNMVLRWRAWRGQNSGNRPPPIDRKLATPGGFVSTETLATLAEEPWERLAPALQHTPYDTVFRKAMEAHQNDGALWPLEKLSDDFLSAFCRMTHYTPFGVEPLVAFAWFSMQETKNLMTVATAKWAGLPPEVVIPRLRRGGHA